MERTDSFPIMTWYGPNKDKYTRKAMQHLAEGGFTTAFVVLRRDQLVPALDVARDVGVKLMIHVEDQSLWRTPGCVDDAWLERFRDTVSKVRQHPAFFGHMVCDEPMRPVFDDIGRVYRLWKEIDPEHMFYVNHWAVGQTFHGARSYEDLWESLYAQAQIGLVSADCYPVQLIDEAELQSHAGEPNYFPRHKAKLVPHFFEMLDIQRQFSARWGKPMWAFTFAKGELSQATAEAEMRFQLMCGLAYGAKGLQYFSYEAHNMLMEDDGSPTENARIARNLNRLIGLWGPVLLRLRSIGVYHYPSNFPYTRPLDQFLLGASTDMFARGDAIVVGHFVDDEGNEHAMIVNRNPFEPALSMYSFGTDTVEECSPKTGAWQPLEGLKDGKFRLAFEPGAARLFRFTRKIVTPGA